MGEVPRIHRVDPSPPVAQHLRVARTGDHPERDRGQGDEGQRDQVDLHGQNEGLEPESAENSEKPSQESQISQGPENRLDIAV